MPKFRNVSGQDRFIVAVNRVVEEDAVFEVSDDEAPGFECQPSNYLRLDEAPVKSKAKE